MLQGQLVRLRWKDCTSSLVKFYKVNKLHLTWLSPAFISFLIFIIWSIEIAASRSFNIKIYNTLLEDDVFKFIMINILSFFYLYGYAVFLYIKKIKFQGYILVFNIILIIFSLFMSIGLLDHFFQPLFMRLEFILNNNFYNECKAKARKERDGLVANCKSYNVSLISVNVIYDTTSNIYFGWDISNNESFVSLGNGFYYLIANIDN